MNLDDTTPEERESAAEMGVTVDKLREVRGLAREWAARRPWWRRIFSR